MSQSDAVSLRMLLGRIDGSAPAIQAAAAAMMRHYDKSAGVAVVEWRNCLHNCRRDQLMPLLYVANEVLQNSKRNRGNKFLEAFSPVLGQSIVHMVQQDSSIVEKIRRTVKIWGDRRVLSVRFVNELLHGLDPFRDGGSNKQNNNYNNQGANMTASRPPPGPPPMAAQQAAAVVAAESQGFSPITELPEPSGRVPNPDEIIEVVDDADDQDNNHDVSMHDEEDEEEEDDDFDFFLRDISDGSGVGGLDVQLEVDPNAIQRKTAASNAASVNQRWLKRRRSSMESAGSASSQASAAKRASLLRGPPNAATATSSAPQRRKNRRRKSVNLLSTNSLLELWNQVASLQQSFDYSLAMLGEITPESLSDKSQDLETMVGDSLLEQYRQVLRFQELVSQQRRSIHAVAQERYQLQKEAVRYLPWLELALKQDLEDIAFCNELEQKLELVRDVHGPARKARDERLAEEELKRAQEEELERKRKEEAERLKFLESALNKETEAKPGMVWNRATQEYQYLNTEESWRD